MPIYDPTCFDAADVQAARQIILTPEYASTEERWLRETPAHIETIIRECRLTPGQVVLDYGCGIGRIARELIDRAGVTVIGVDISRNMRQFARDYVANDDRFICASPRAFDGLASSGMRVDAAVAVWVLQHCATPQIDSRRIRNALKPGGKFHVVNNVYRAVPTDAGWANDGIDVRALLNREFRETNYFPLSAELVPQENFRRFTFCATYENSLPPSGV